ncbi:unnamed protein product [Echinostoma caproni]|uniref:Similar to n=1 Tax=Echinostoma caproni TaxID=27848 RepID=A0A183AQY1_9TREM|nr:unnamed protein product [Echinostoma caproni]
MLIEPPFLWDPDKPDAFGWTAMQLAEALNNIHTMYPLACASRELRHFEPLVLNKENHLITTRLFWPQDMMVYTFLKSPISTRRARTRNRIPLETPWQLSRGGPELFGSHLALLFELLLSESPPLPRGDWDHDQVEPLVTWPIRMAPLRNREGHTPDCTNYPNCLSTHWLQPALTDTQAHIYPNYAKILGELNLPAEIFDFLLYRDLWPVQNRKETIEQEEEPVAKRACFYKWTEQFGVGLRIAHGFIPLSADS